MTGEPRDLDILKALTRHLEGISQREGYAFDLYGRVFRGRVRFGRDDALPMLSILEAPQTENLDVVESAAEFGRMTIRRWPILIQGWAENDDQFPSDPAYYLKAACIHRLSKILAVDPRSGDPADEGSYLLGRRIAGLRMQHGLVSPPREGVSDFAFFYLPVVVEYPADPSTPFV